MKNASEELWCSIRCKQNLHSIDLMILFKIRIVKNFESVKSFNILARLLLYDCSLSLGKSWLRINKSTGIWIQMHTFYAIQIYVIYRRMHSRKKWLLFLQNYCRAMKLFSPGSKHTATITHCFRRRRCFSYHSTRKKSLEIKFHVFWLSSWSYLWSVWCIQLIESCLPDGFGCDKCGESIKIFLINGWILLLPLLRSLFSTIAPTLMCTRKSEPHFSRSKAELVLLEISLVRTGIINFVADFNTYTLNVRCSQVICGRISF